MRTEVKPLGENTISDFTDAGWTVILVDQGGRRCLPIRRNYKHPSKWSVNFTDDGRIKSLDVKVKFDLEGEDGNDDAATDGSEAA